MFNELDLKSLWQELDAFSGELDKETKSLQEVWLTIANIKAQNEIEIKDLASKPEFMFLPEDAVIAMNVGGQLFETPVEVLTKDPYSILAACCRIQTPIKPDAEGVFYFDRDWWLFRHILTYLRTNRLPNEMETLKELYKEASFFRLEILQRAIEDIPVDQVTNYSPQITVISQGLPDKDYLPSSRLSDKRGQEDRIYERPMFQYR